MEKKEDESSFIRAVECNDTESIKQLLEAGFCPWLETSMTSDPVCLAVREGHTETLKLLLQHGLNPCRPDRHDPPWHRAPIHLSSVGGHVDCVRLLLEAGVEIDTQDQQQRTPLYWAAVHNRLSVAKFLLEAGCSVNVLQGDEYLWSPLHAATCLGYDQLCKMLIDYGAKIDIGDKDGWTPLHSAACYGHQQSLSYLLQGGAKVDQRTNCEETALHIASGCGHIGVIKNLLLYGADVNSVDVKGCTAFHIAVFQDKYEVGKYLAGANADVDTVSAAGYSPLYLAAMRAQEDFLQLILSVGVDLKKHPWLTKGTFSPVLKAHPQLCQWLIDFCRNPRTLKHLCALAVRKMIGQNFLLRISSLEIPDILKEYTTLPFV